MSTLRFRVNKEPERPGWAAWAIGGCVVALITRGAIGLLDHNSCTGVPNFGEPVRGTARAGFCDTFDHPWAAAGVALALTILGAAVVRRRAGWGAAICIAVVVAAIAIAIVGSRLDAVPTNAPL